MRFIKDCQVISNEEIAPGHYRLRVRDTDIPAVTKPGQFCMLQTAPGLYPFLRRPMSIHGIFCDGISFLYKVEGEGTRLLAGITPGQTMSIQGPLGNGFTIDPALERHIIVAGGIGIAPFPPLAKAIAQICGKPPEVVLAARSRNLLIGGDDFREMGCRVHVATDDGSAGQKGYAAQMLEALAPDQRTCVYACGPMIMMKTTSDVAVAHGARCLVSLEAQMACGDGACLGCVVESKLEHEGEKMVRVCADGPVFDTTIIDWEAHNTTYDL